MLYRHPRDRPTEPLRLLHNLIEHFLGEPAPPPLSADQLTLIVREAATVAAREAAREVIAELLGKPDHATPVPAAWAEIVEPAGPTSSSR
jgi:hypothetical protein